MAAKKKSNRTSSGPMRQIKDVSPTTTSASNDPIFPDTTRQNRLERVRLSFPVIAIGASAGGLNAFKKFFKAMSADSGMAFVLVPHLDPTHESLMVELLSRQTTMPVLEAKEGQLIEVNHVYVIPPNKFLAINEGRLRLTVLPEPRGRQTALRVDTIEEPSLITQLENELRATREDLQRTIEELESSMSIADAAQRRIGQDLHDDIGQELTGLAMKAETLSEIVTERQIPEHALAADIVAGLDRTRAKVRALSRGLIPVEIDALGLVNALDQLTARLGDVHHGTCVFECRDRSVEIDAHQAAQLYHIAQEAITNALKHAQARNIRVTLDARKSAVTLEVRDDGIGIPGDMARQDGMGLRTMSYRAGLIHGKLDIRRHDTGGTLVSCLVVRGAEHGPYNSEELGREC
jgi:signal transduction histidine kinase